MAIEAKTGNVFPGRKGNYRVLSIGRDTLDVEYIDGEWKGTKVTMSKVTHNAMQLRMPIESQVLTSKKLDLWWEKFPSLY